MIHSMHVLPVYDNPPLKILKSHNKSTIIELNFSNPYYYLSLEVRLLRKTYRKIY